MTEGSLEKTQQQEKFDIYSWILSQEIREAWRKQPPLPLLEQAGIIFPAYRSVEEKLEALTALLSQAETREEKKFLRKAVAYYGEAIRQMKGEDGKAFPGKRQVKEIWVAGRHEYDMALEEHPNSLDYLVEPHLFYSYEAAKAWAACLVEEETECWNIRKWDCREEGPEEVLECSLRLVNGRFCATHIYGERDRDFNRDHRLPYPLPFSIGELVKLEGPVFSEPLFGIWCGETDYFGCWYNWMGYITEKETDGVRLFTVRNMGYHRLSAYDLCVLDWLRPASREELPKEQRVLAEISEKIGQIRQEEGEEKAAEQFWDIFKIGR